MKAVSGYIMRIKNGLYYRLTYTNKEDRRVNLVRKIYKETDINDLKKSMLNIISSDIKNPNLITEVTEINNKSSSGFIYVVNAIGTDRYKIGMTRTKSTRNRIRQLQTGCPFKIVEIVKGHSDNVQKMEKNLHTEFKAFSCIGEWFELNSVGIEKLITIIKQCENTK